MSIEKERQRIVAAQMKYMRPILKVTRKDKIRNKEITKKLNTENIIEDLVKYQKEVARSCKKDETKQTSKIGVEV